ncbi:MAG: GEVED domain-containing protein, partial [Verrucomicrobiales bacterium]
MMNESIYSRPHRHLRTHHAVKIGALLTVGIVAITEPLSAGDVPIETYPVEAYHAFMEERIALLETSEFIEALGDGETYEGTNEPQFFLGITFDDGAGGTGVPSANTMNGQGGSDLFDMDGLNCAANGGAGADVFQLFYLAKGNVLHGADDGDRFHIFGTAGQKARDGEAATVDQMFGDEGDDVFYFLGGSTNTECSGGSGVDSFVMLPDGGQPFPFEFGEDPFTKAHVVKDFTPGEDKLLAGPDVMATLVGLNDGADTGILIEHEGEQYGFLILEGVPCDNVEPGQELDFGDASNTYATLLASNGARHVIVDGFSLGALVDADTDGAPTPNADGDDSNIVDDEDGVTFLSGSTFVAGTTVADVQVNLTNAAGMPDPVLNAWIDFNANGVFEPTEQIATNTALISGMNIVPPFDVPVAATSNGEGACARFRLTGLMESVGPAGPAETGEVEDYRVFFAPPNDLALSVSPASFSENGGSATGTVTRQGILTHSLVITLSSDDTSEATVPSSVTIPANQTSATFSVTGVDDAIADGTQTVTVTASASAFPSRTANLNVTDDEVPSLQFGISRAPISEGDGAGAATGTITHNIDPSSPLTIILTSSDTTEAMMPTTVTIPAGQSSVQFPIDAVDDAIVDGAQEVTFTATASGFTNGVKIIDVLDDDVATLTLSITEDSVSESAGTGVTQGTVELNTVAGTNISLSVSSNDTSEAQVTTTVAIIIAAGTNSATFFVDAVDDALVDGTQTVTFTASAPGYVSGTDTIDVTDDDTPTLTLSIDKASVFEFGGVDASHVTVTHNLATMTPLSVSISNSDTTEIAAPSTLAIPAGQNSSVFWIDAVDDNIVDGDKTVTLSASASGLPNASDTVVVVDDDLPLDWGDLPEHYAVTDAEGGPRHLATADLRIGTVIDVEPDGTHSPIADADDMSGTATDDEDGLASLPHAEAGRSVTYSVPVLNTTGAPAVLYGYLDWDGDGEFVTGGEVTSVPVPHGTSGTSVGVNFAIPFNAHTLSGVGLRLRLLPEALGRQGEFPASDGLKQLPTNPDPGSNPANLSVLETDQQDDTVIFGNVVLGQVFEEAFVFYNDGGQELTVSTLALLDSSGGVVEIINAPAVPFTLAPGKDNGKKITVRFSPVLPGDYSTAIRFTSSDALNTDASGAFYVGIRHKVLPVPGEVEDYLVEIAAPDYDFGDLPEDGGDLLPTGYKTLLANDGPRHAVLRDGTDALLYLGRGIDGESDGQPVTGDGSDEDGVTVSGIVAGGKANFTVVATNLTDVPPGATGQAAYIHAFADWNADGDFDDADETLAAPVKVDPGKVMEPFPIEMNVPFYSAVGKLVGVRFRYSTTQSLANTGIAPDGEVEDYFFDIGEPAELDWGDAPETGTPGWDRPGYATTRANNGPRHGITKDLYFEPSLPDSEADGIPSADFTGDDGWMPAEGAVGVDANLEGHILRPVIVYNRLPVAAEFSVFADTTSDGSFDYVERHEIPAQTDESFEFEIKADLFEMRRNTIAVRFRLSSQFGLSADGFAADGEVEDVLLENFVATEFGDLPLPYDQTAGHFSDNSIRVLRLGTAVDSEYSPQPHPDAGGDDLDSDDEDGVSFPSLLRPLQPGDSFPVFVSVRNGSGEDAYLIGFIDWNGDGDFDDLNETSTRVAIPSAPSQQHASGVEFRVPGWSNVVRSKVGARFRISRIPDLGPTGFGAVGEVEDYMLDLSAFLPSTIPAADGGRVLANGPVRLGPEYLPRTYLNDLATLTWAFNTELLPGGEWPELTDAQVAALKDGSASLFATINGNTTLQLQLEFLEEGILDFGDLQDDAGGAVAGTIGIAQAVLPDFRTRLAEGGPRHFSQQGLYFDTLDLFAMQTPVDVEPNANTSYFADGDDQTADADETAPKLTLVKQTVTTLPAGGTHTHRIDAELELNFVARNLLSGNAYIRGWCDLNFDGDFSASEELAIALNGGTTSVVPPESTLPPPGPGGDTLAGFPGTFTIPVQISIDAGGACHVSTTTILPIRIRYTTNPFLGADDSSGSSLVFPGEVEDHLCWFGFEAEVCGEDEEVDSLQVTGIDWSPGAPLQISPALIPEAYRDGSEDAEWFLNGEPIGKRPLLDPIQAESVTTRESKLEFNTPRSTNTQVTIGDDTISVIIDNDHRVTPFLVLSGNGPMAIKVANGGAFRAGSDLQLGRHLVPEPYLQDLNSVRWVLGGVVLDGQSPVVPWQDGLFAE